MDKDELLKEIRKLYQSKRTIQNKIDTINKQLDEIAKAEAGKEYLHEKQEEILSTFAI